MKSDSLSLVRTKIELLLVGIFLFTIFLVNISIEYLNYKKINEEEIYQSNALIVNTYKNNTILKLQTNEFIFYTKNNINIPKKKLDKVKVLFISKYITFYDYLKGFFVKTIDIEILQKTPTLKSTLVSLVDNSHNNKLIKELFNALFFAIPISTQLREVCTNYGISHLIAISGFHLGLLSFILYFLLNIFYSPIHQKYYNYRNKKVDILFVVISILFFYLIFTGFIPSLLRAFIMFIIGIYFLRSNIKILSFNTLLITLVCIIAFFPRYIFSLSLWFSIFGVFYIYLFIKYFQGTNKILLLFLFNFWIFFALNPIIHYFFDASSYMQLLSPFVSIFFSFFYPLELLIHILGVGSIFDEYILWFLTLETNVYFFKTSFSFLIIYLGISFGAIFKKEFFIGVNILFIGFNIFLFLN